MRLIDWIARARTAVRSSVSVDWVVLTAGMVAIAIGIAAFLSDGLGDLATLVDRADHDG